MNLILLTIGIWFAVFFVCICIFAYAFDKKNTKEYGGTILIISFIISSAIAFLIGGIIG